MELLSDKHLKDTYKPLENIFKSIQKVRQELNIVFVFGSASKASTRSLFIKYLKTVDKKLIYITIEHLTKDLKKYVLQSGMPQELIKLIDLEYKVINLSYCVLIFPESPGSFAELGFFSKDLKTKQKIFALKDYTYVNDDSYVNRLINYIHQDRDITYNTLKFKTIKNKKLEKELIGIRFPEIMKKIEAPYKEVKNSLDKKVSNIKKEELPILPLAIIHELILNYSQLTYTELKAVYKNSLQKNFKKIRFDKDEMNYILSLLVVSKYIKRKKVSDTYAFVNLNPRSFFEFDEKIYETYALIRKEISLDIRIAKSILR